MSEPRSSEPRWSQAVEDALVVRLELSASSNGARCRAVAQEYLGSLADAGLLVAPGGEVREEWGVADDPNHPDEVWPVRPHRAPTHRRTITVHTGPWLPAARLAEEENRHE